MQILRKKSKSGRTVSYVTDDGLRLCDCIDRVNLQLKGCDRLLAERNDLDIQCQNRSITIVELNKVITELRQKTVL